MKINIFSLCKIVFFASSFLLINLLSNHSQAQTITQEGSKKIFSVATEQEFRNAIAQAKDGDEIRLANDVTIFPQGNDQSGHALPFRIDKAVTIEGQGRRLSFTRGLPIETLKNVTFQNMNLDMLPESGVNASYIYASDNTLIFNNVTTRVQGQSEEVRPTIVAGNYGNSTSEGTHARIIIKNIGQDAGAFHKIIAGNRNNNKTTPTSIEIEAPIRIREGILLGNEAGQMSGDVSVVNKSNGVTKFQGNTTGTASVKFEGVSASNLSVTNLDNVTLVRSNITPQNYGFSVKNTLSIDENSTLNLSNFDEDITLAEVLSGSGEIELSNEIEVSVSQRVEGKPIIRLEGFSFTEADVKRALTENGSASRNVIYIWKNERYYINEKGELVKENQGTTTDNSGDDDNFFGDDDDDDDTETYEGEDDGGFFGDIGDEDGNGGNQGGTDENEPNLDDILNGNTEEGEGSGSDKPTTGGENAGTETDNPNAGGNQGGTDENEPNLDDILNGNTEEGEGSGNHNPTTDRENAGTETDNPNAGGNQGGTNENEPNIDDILNGNTEEGEGSGNHNPTTDGENNGTETDNPNAGGNQGGTEGEEPNLDDILNGNTEEGEGSGSDNPTTDGENAGTETENQPNIPNPPSTNGKNAGTETENQPNTPNPPSTNGKNAGTETENQPNTPNPPTTDGENAGTDIISPKPTEKKSGEAVILTNYINKNSAQNDKIYIQGRFEKGELLIFNEMGQKIHHLNDISPVQEPIIGLPLEKTPVQLEKVVRGVYFYIFRYKTTEGNHKKTGFLYVL